MTLWDSVQDRDALDALSASEVESELAKSIRSGESAGRLEDAAKPALARLATLCQDVADEFVDRQEAVNAIVASLISGVSSVLLGPPGTAKSAMVREVAQRCGLGPAQQGRGYFEYLLTSHTMPEELFGPPDIQLLVEQKVYQRNVDGMLPTAELAFLDEVFRGSGHILNTLLSLLNERVFHDGREIRRVPLVGVVGAANAAPTDPDLGAFYDRFPVRIWLESVLSKKDGSQSVNQRAIQLLRKSGQHEMRSLIRGYAEESSDLVRPCASMHDIRIGRALVTKRLAEAKFDAVIETRFVDAFRRLTTRCRLSDRFLFAIRRFAEALALLRSTSEQQDRARLEAFQFVAPSAEELRAIQGDIQEALDGAGHRGAA